MLTIPEFLAARGQVKPVDCPHCGRRLNAQFRIVIATRNCPHCGQRVVAEPEGDGTPPFTRESNSMPRAPRTGVRDGAPV